MRCGILLCAAPGSNSRRVTTRAGTGTAASLAGMVAARSSGAADGISPVHGAYGLAIEEEVEDLLSSHMKFMQGRSSPSNGSGSSQRSGLGGKSVSYRGGASSKPMDARQGEMPIALVAIVTFDLRQGPCLVCVDPPIEDEQGQPTLPLSTADIHVLRSDMPFKALPENGLAAAELSQGPSRTAPSENEGGIWAWAKGWVMPSGEGGGAHGRDSGRGGDARGGGVGGSQQHHGHCLFMLRVSGENLFGMSHFLRVEDPDSPRGYTQGAAVCLSRLPFFGLVLQRLHAFSMDVIDRSGCAGQLAALAADLRETRFEDLGHSSVYQDLPVPTVLLKLRSKLLAVLRLLLLEGRVLFCAKSAATVSEAVMAVASLLPGSLPLGLGRLDPPGFGLKAYRWRKHGFPLKLFRKEAPLEPLVVIAGAADVLAKDGFFADLLLNVDTWEARWGKTERAKAALDMGEPDRSFARELVRATKRHLGGGVGGDGSMEGVGWQGSSAWIADQFQLHFEDLVTTAAECLARNASLEEARRREEEEEEQRRKAALEDGGRGSAMKMIAGVVTPTLDGIGLNKAWQQTATWLNGSGPVPVAAALESHGQRWSELWTESENFGVWQSSHRLAGANGNPSEALPPSSSLRSEPGDGGNSNSNSNSDPNKAALGPPTTAKFSNSSGSGSTLANALLCSNGLAGAGAFFIDDVRSSSSSSAKKAGSEGAPRSGVKTYTYENSGDTYTGSWQNGRRHGVGVYEERATGNSYEGDWVEDARHGRGVLTSGDKDFVYDGEWVDDKRTGVGNSVIRGTETYSGRWKDGEFHGGGVHCDARGNVYDGEFVHGQREGVGRWTAKSGLEYVGEWRAGQMSGVGQSTEKDGTAYSGEWHNGRYSGEGTLTLPTGARYEGMFREGEKHGSGSLLTAEGDTLEGEWVKSRPQEGDTEWRIRFANGDHFAGTVLEGVPHGTGTYKYSNGDIFTGGWDRGLRHGQGICVFANGEKFEGEWVRDHISYQGKGALTLADGTTHDFA
ncbi:conserved unknown protein [Ectocarpus siliculosus]|uniref:AVL9/DENND6 domain-containing protein n=1 Tax=Ectocarpus siliculosus TaxID=2880 RepID=D7FT00_ECTSI|nr:conserved unknown protein [Ectocarpus siliculosus]|eukprot:CBJ31291.1 conserved unknown protein [Ectocarpus siliculosus]